MTRFVILTLPRSGSTWLVDALNQHPNATVFGEALQPGRRRPFRFGAADLDPYEAALLRTSPRPRRWPPYVVEYLRALYDTGEAGSAVGFKLMYGHARARPLGALYLRWIGVRVVHLVRANAVDAVISSHVSAARGRGGGHATEGAPLHQIRLEIDPGWFVKEVAARERAVSLARRTLSLTAAPTAEVTYEAMSAEPGTTLDRISRFLGLPPAPDPLQGATQRLATGAQGDHVTNFDAVRAALIGAGYANLLRRSE